MIYMMGKEAVTVQRTFVYDAFDPKSDPNPWETYKVVLAKFNAYVRPRQNQIHGRAKFGERRQREGESTEGFIWALYELAAEWDEEEEEGDEEEEEYFELRIKF